MTKPPQSTPDADGEELENAGCLLLFLLAVVIAAGFVVGSGAFDGGF